MIHSIYFNVIQVFRMGDDYTPQLSNVIIAKMLSCTSEGQCTMKILRKQKIFPIQEKRCNIVKTLKLILLLYRRPR